jgi:hypothetical protein
MFTDYGSPGAPTASYCHNAVQRYYVPDDSDWEQCANRLADHFNSCL